MTSTAVWKKSLTQSIKHIDELLQLLKLKDHFSQERLATFQKFPLRVTREFAKRIIPGDPRDPLLLQILPTQKENILTANFNVDPLKEKDINPISGLLHRYQGRVLLILSGACAINCRYCFRRHFPYEDNHARHSAFAKILEYIRNDPSIEEVIYSGGEPLIVDDPSLKEMTGLIAEIPHVNRLRFHTRMPIVLPSRIDNIFMEWISKTRLEKVFVIHCNHPQEIDKEVEIALQRLRQVGTVLNQSVLLAGINDKAETLMDLSRTLFSNGVLPYYLHALDYVQGAAHFEVPLQKGQELINILREKLPGYLVPKFVKTQSGASSKLMMG